MDLYVSSLYDNALEKKYAAWGRDLEVKGISLVNCTYESNIGNELPQHARFIFWDPMYEAAGQPKGGLWPEIRKMLDNCSKVGTVLFVMGYPENFTGRR